jgi:methylated-DNA-[protein]-cysteine S-methyltransferase
MADQEETLEDLQSEWKHMFQHLLPEAARSNSPSQVHTLISTLPNSTIAKSPKPKWPVTLDHCFARIILDATVGMDAPWTSKIESPAYKNMSKPQLRWSIELGRRILEGEEDLVELDNMSLQLRSKNRKVDGNGRAGAQVDGGKRKQEGREDAEQDAANTFKAAKILADGTKRAREGGVEGDPKTAVTLEDTDRNTGPPTPSPNERSPYFATTTRPNPLPSQKNKDLSPYLKKIALSQKTHFQKKVLTLLCQIPRGKYTTYAAISKYLSSSPRAVGNAIRNNPFAPHVPCHRVLASGGGIGGFHGSWGRNGEKGLNDDKKRELLREEGVRFYPGGKVVGCVWEGFR